MKIAVTVRFQNSYFSGSLPQIACSLARTFAQAGHEVNLLYPKGEADWFVDVPPFAAAVPPRVSTGTTTRYDIVVEVVWQLSPADRKTYANQVIYFVHYPAVFYDMESSVYPWNPLRRSFTNLAAIWTYSHARKQDIRYLEFLSGVPVVTVPYIWDADPLDTFVEESKLSTWAESAKRIESMLPADLPPVVSWNIRIMESNFSNSSHSIIPLSIVSQIRVAGDPVRFGVHNGEQLAKNEFFRSNIVRNLLLPDISGSIVPRVRLPDLIREKTLFITHQRFRPIKSFLLDALYLGIPMIHNCEMLKEYGPYFYELNEIQAAVDAWNILKADYAQSLGFFAPDTLNTRRNALRQRFSVQALSTTYNTILTSPLPLISKIIEPPQPPITKGELRVAFCDMWDEFQPKHNFFMYLLAWVGRLNNIKVINDQQSPNVVFFGPLSKGTEARHPNVPKVYFTGENSPPNKDSTTFLNIGFQYLSKDDYIRLPLWVLEINWFGADINKLVNPRPVNLSDCLTANPTTRNKFCAFVATNPSNQNRNAAFSVLNQWRRVDSGGRLFCNLPTGPIPAGMGGGGGELAKVEFYKNYNFALTFENSSAQGYTTEKLFHAKVAGAVPIYWGDPFVDRDFDPNGFINANQAGNAQELIQMVAKVADDEHAWRKMASVPALSEFKKIWCERTMGQVAKNIFKRILGKDVVVNDKDWESAQAFGSKYEDPQALETVLAPSVELITPTRAPVAPSTSNLKRQVVTACNAKYMEAAVNMVASLKKTEPNVNQIVYIYPDITPDKYELFKSAGATEIRILPTKEHSQTPWPDFWEPQHFAWKLWVHQNALQEADNDALILYMDAGIVVTSGLTAVWNQIDAEGVFLLDDAEHPNRRWCHPDFCSVLSTTEYELSSHQLWAGCVGFKKGHAFNVIHENALTLAKNHRNALVGEKWSSYSKDCLGHRHDQSVLSIFTQRSNCPRLPLKEFYCDVSMRAAQQWGTPLYVHRGNFRAIVPFTDGISEAYVINLPRRADRLNTFKQGHATIKDRVYLWKAIDGRKLELTQEIVHCFRDNDFGWKKSVMGCALSHLGLWEKLAADTLAKSYLIMEDDVRLEDRWMLQWVQSAASIPQDADVIYLGGILPPNKGMFPTIIEPVNKWFAKVKPNTLFQPIPKRYFHFCNYAYVLTQAGARKLCTLVKERGIFTSGDHMIVNHGDTLLNIYFTTPLVATCFQEDDPAYQRSEFNNFKRVDNFDSDLWNNTECFSKEEVMECLTKNLQSQIIASTSEQQSKPSQPTQPQAIFTHEDHVKVWNTFLREISMGRPQEIPGLLDTMFKIWKTMNNETFLKNFGWYRIFEQLVVSKNEILMTHASYIIHLAKATFDVTQPIFEKLISSLEEHKGSVTPAITMYQGGETKPSKAVFHMKEIGTNGMCELQWLDFIHDINLKFCPLTTMSDILESPAPTLLYQKIPGKDVTPLFTTFLDILNDNNKQATIIHTSDEFANDNISFYNHPAISRVIRNYWRKDLAQYGPNIHVIPLGYANARHGTHLPASPTFEERPNLWGFAGSMDRPGRNEALLALRKASPYAEHILPQWGSPNQLQGPEYIDMFRKAKFVPCFRGSYALESYRFYEALEHGAIPVYVPAESHDTTDEFKELFGSHPFLGFPSWDMAATLLPKLANQTEAMEKHRQTLQTWWTNKKIETQKLILGNSTASLS